MKKAHIVFSIVFLILLVSILLFFSTFHLVKTKDDVMDVLRQELQLTENNDVTISYLGEYSLDEDSLFWFLIQNQSYTLYRAVECHPLIGGWSHVAHIYDPMTYASDIVHVIWKGEDIILMNNPDCQSLVYKDDSGRVVTTTEFSSSELPYVFLHKPLNGTSDFLDYEGNKIPY